MTPAKRLSLAFLGVAIALILLSTITTAGLARLKNDNGDFYAGSRFGRLEGDIDGAVFIPGSDSFPEDIFPITIKSVEFAFHEPQENTPPYIGDSAQVRVQIYAMKDGKPDGVLAESAPRRFSTLDGWLSIPFDDPPTIEQPASFMAAVKWESGDDDERALPLALDSNLAASQAEKDAKNLYQRVDVHMPQACRDGFCTHSELGLRDAEGQSMGFNMIRVVIDSPRIPTETPTTPTATPTVTPSPTPNKPRVYVPVLLHNHHPAAEVLHTGDGVGEAASYPLTSGDGLAERCWEGSEGGEWNLWVGREPADERGIMRSVIRFDLSAIPSEASLLKAELQLTLREAEADGGQTMPVSVHNVTRPWPDCPTWNNIGDAAGKMWSVFPVSSSVESHTADVTNLVGAWLSGELPNHGLMLQGDEAQVGRLRGFVPTASTQEDLRPSLSIRYLQPAN